MRSTLDKLSDTDLLKKDLEAKLQRLVEEDPPFMFQYVSYIYPI